ncbi:hypothetical protein BsIDN1_03190 [Bacillus safensis]|uniref:Glutamine--fructose-6-phosphate aminotransferase [isomerizing] n=1 Tax=Bacillus safensis TaxID=561879 RepID=A0A5S9M149_BACIA|nr:hypothetical protein BsIDN1_03190 [Bacillus safensis]
MNSRLLCAKSSKNIKTKNGKLSVAGDIASAVAEADRIYIVACGTSYHAGLVGKQYIEDWAKVPVEVHVASEFSYNMPLLSKKSRCSSSFLNLGRLRTAVLYLFKSKSLVIKH